jgi:DNA-binding transcriptional MerR regulator
MKLVVSDVARILGVTPATVRAMERRGEIIAERTLSGVRIFDNPEVERVKAARDQKRPTSAGEAA